MAPRPEDLAQQDGAKPGAAARVPADVQGYDADAHAKARERARFTIGAGQFVRVRKTWAVSRKMRALLREQDRATARIERLGAQINAQTEKLRGILGESGEWKVAPVTDDAELMSIEDAVEQLQAAVDEQGDRSDEIAYELLLLLLRAAGDTPLTMDLLRSELDVDDAGRLVALVAHGVEQDPTPATSSSSSS